MTDEERAAYKRKAEAHVAMVEESVRRLILSADVAVAEVVLQKACEAALLAIRSVVSNAYGVKV